jgi:DNA-binding MarR family transcriptional regulator
LQEQKQAKSRRRHPTLEVADRLHSAAIHLLRRARRKDTESGVGPAQLSALSVLVFGGPATLGQLAAFEQVRPPTMTRIVQGLRRGGLARLQSDPEDARRVRVSATPAGSRVLERARRKRIEALAEVLANLSQRDLQRLRAAAAIIEHTLLEPPK